MNIIKGMEVEFLKQELDAQVVMGQKIEEAEGGQMVCPLFKQ